MNTPRRCCLGPGNAFIHDSSACLEPSGLQSLRASERRKGTVRTGEEMGGMHGKECIDLTFSAPSGALVLDAQQQLGAAVELEGAALSPGDHTGLR